MWRVSVLIAVVCGLNGCNTEQPVGPSCPAVLSGWSKPTDGKSVFRPMNVVAFAASGITWNKLPVAYVKLHEYLTASRTMNPAPLIVFDPIGAPNCRAAIELRDEINEAADCQGQGVCGQGSLGDWKKAPGFSGPDWIE